VRFYIFRGAYKTIYGAIKIVSIKSTLTQSEITQSPYIYERQKQEIISNYANYTIC